MRSVLLLLLTATVAVHSGPMPNRRIRSGHIRTNDEADPEYGEYWQGDIMLSPKEQENLSQPESSFWNSITDESQYWPGGKIPYVFDGSVPSSSREAILEAIDKLVEETKVNGKTCIEIVPRQNEEDYVRVVDEGRCSSYKGVQGGAQKLGIGEHCLRIGTVMHEFLHALGFFHEHVRADRTDYVRIHRKNIISSKKHNFKKEVEHETINHLGTPYDYDSVMHYGTHAFAEDPDLPTITPKDPDAEIGQRTHLSYYDIKRVQILYGCIEPEES